MKKADRYKMEWDKGLGYIEQGERMGGKGIKESDGRGNGRKGGFPYLAPYSQIPRSATARSRSKSTELTSL